MDHPSPTYSPPGTPTPPWLGGQHEKTEVLALVIETQYKTPGRFGWVLDNRHLRDVQAVSLALKQHPAVAVRIQSEFAFELAWMRSYSVFVQWLATRYGVAVAVMAHLLEAGPAAAFAHQLIAKSGTTGGVQRGGQCVRWIMPKFQGFHSSHLGVRTVRLHVAVAVAEGVFGADLHKYLEALYHLHYWNRRRSPLCLYRCFMG